VDANRELLRSMVENKNVFVVIDGLDEIPEGERASLLKCMLGLLNECSNMKLLISSRGEHDVARLLKHHAEVIRVHAENGYDIEEYVKARVDNWLLAVDLDDQIASEVRQLLISIATKARGEQVDLWDFQSRAYVS
jgi:hypothetical protein